MAEDDAALRKEGRKDLERKIKRERERRYGASHHQRGTDERGANLQLLIAFDRRRRLRRCAVRAPFRVAMPAARARPPPSSLAVGAKLQKCPNKDIPHLVGWRSVKIALRLV